MAQLSPSETHTLLESRDLVVGEGVRLGDNRNEVDLGVKSTHDLDIKRLERVAGRLNEVHAGVHAVVDDVHAVDLVLGIKVGIKALLDVLDNWAPGIVVVHKVTKTRSVHNGQTQADAILLNVCADGLDAHSLRCEVERWLFALLRWVERGVEKRVDESRLSEARFT